MPDGGMISADQLKEIVKDFRVTGEKIIKDGEERDRKDAERDNERRHQRRQAATERHRACRVQSGGGVCRIGEHRNDLTIRISRSEEFAQVVRLVVTVE